MIHRRPPVTGSFICPRCMKKYSEPTPFIRHCKSRCPHGGDHPSIPEVDSARNAKPADVSPARPLAQKSARSQMKMKIRRETVARDFLHAMGRDQLLAELEEEMPSLKFKKRKISNGNAHRVRGP